MLFWRQRTVAPIVDFRFYFLPFCQLCIFWIDKKYVFTPTLNLCTSLHISFWLKYCSPDVCQAVMLALDIWLFCLYVCRLLSLFLLSVLCICEVISFPLFCCMLIYLRLPCFCDSHLIWIHVAVKPTNTSEMRTACFFPSYQETWGFFFLFRQKAEREHIIVTSWICCQFLLPGYSKRPFPYQS